MYLFVRFRFVYTKLLAILGKARKPTEALQVFNLMRVIIPSEFCAFNVKVSPYILLDESLILNRA